MRNMDLSSIGLCAYSQEFSVPKKKMIRALFHQTKDPYRVRDVLGRKELRDTEIYINIERTIFEPRSDEFTVKVVEKTEDVKALLEVGFEYVCQKDNLIFLRRRK